jgi:gamma-tubulin complex component 4
LQNSQDLVLTGRELEEVTHISEEFSRQASLFFDIVSGIKVHGCAPHLAQLLLRVDYNKYFSSTKHFMQTKLRGPS